MIVKVTADNHLKYQKKTVVLDISYFQTEIKQLPEVCFYVGNDLVLEATLPASTDLNHIENRLNEDFFKFSRAELRCFTFKRG